MLAGALAALVLLQAGPPSAPAPSVSPLQSPSSSTADETSNEGSFKRLAGAVLQASEQASVICLGETHGHLADAALRSALLAHPEFVDAVDVILFEGASGLHQGLIDDFVLEGADFSRSQLQPIWEDAGRGVMWQLPIYEQFLRELHELNATLPRERRVRLIGAAAPIPWEDIETPQDLEPWLDRLSYQRRLIRKEVLEPGLRALAVFGKLHCQKSGEHLAARILEEAPASVWSAFGFSGAEAASQARQRLGLPDQPTLMVISSSSYAELRAEDAFFELHKFNGMRFGEVLDAIVSYGRGQDVVLTVDDTIFSANFAQELLRRDRLRSEALGSTNGS